MTQFILIRHGQTDWNNENRYQGQVDIPLNETGREQARAAASAVRAMHIDAVYCSPFERAKETAAIILGEDCPLEVHYDRRLIERSFGDYEGGYYEHDKMEPKYIAQMKADPEHFKFPNGESLIDVTERVRPFYEEIIAKHPNESVLVVAHGTLLSMLINIIEGQPVKDSTRMHLANATPLVYQSR